MDPVALSIKPIVEVLTWAKLRLSTTSTLTCKNTRNMRVRIILSGLFGWLILIISALIPWRLKCADDGNSVVDMTRELGHRVLGDDQTDLVADKTCVGKIENADGTFGC